MAKKLSSKKSFKSFFSKSEANLSETVEKSAVEKNATDKKKFKFPGLKVKSKSSATSEKSTHESEQVLSVAKPEENEENVTDRVSTDTKRSSLYATGPRSKIKELSLSEMDLNKPKRFATFSLGLKKKKKKNDILSKSTFGIDSIEAQQETPLDQTNTKTMSMSQPELDTSEHFDIPTPPPVAINEAEFPLPNQSQTSVTVHTQPNHKALENVQNLSQKTQKAPIATIPELNLDYNKVNTVIKETTLNVSSCKEAKTPPSQVRNMISDIKAPDSVSGNIALFNNGNLRESNTKPEISLSQQTQSQEQSEINTAPTIDSKMAATVTDKQTDSSATVGIPALATKLTNVDTKTASRITEPSPISTENSSTLDPLSISPKVPISQTASSLFETEKKAMSSPITIKSNTPVSSKDNSTLEPIASNENITISQKSLEPENKTTPTLSQTTKKTDPPANQYQVYGDLYDSLFPQKFTSEVISSLLKEPTQMASDIRHLEVKTETVLVKTLDEQYSDRSTSYSTLSASSPEKTDNDVGYSSTHSYSQSVNTSSSLLTSSPKKMDDLVGYSSTHSSSQSVNTSSSLMTSSPKKMDDLVGYSSTRSSSQSVNTSSSLLTSSQKKMDDLVGYSSTHSSSQYCVNISSCRTSTVDEKPTKDTPKPVFIRKVITYDVSSDVASKMPSEHVKIAYSEFNSETKFDSVRLENNVKSTLSAEKSSAPPVFECAASQETNALVTDPKRKVILVKELVTDETGADSDCPSPVLEKMSVLRSLENEIDVSDVFSVTSGQNELNDGICSPAYLSVGSDDGSMLEIYYSAEEDAVDEKEATVIDAMKDESAFEDFISNRTFITEDANATMVEVNTLNSEENPFKVEMHLGNQKIQEQKGSRMSNPTQEREAAVQVIKDENDTKVEFLAPPVEQGKEFKVVPPFTERHGHKEGLGISQNALSERKDHPLVQEQLPNKETDIVPPKEVKPLHLEPKSVSKSDKLLITPKFTQAAELVLSTSDESKYAAKTTVDDNSEQRLDATGLGDNRAALSSKGADTVTQSTVTNGTEQVAVKLSAQNNTLLTTTTNEKKQLVPQDQVDLNQGSLTPLKTPALEVFVEEKQLDTAAVVLDDKMSSSFSSLSTTLSLKTPSLSTNEEPKYSFRKVSLVSKTDESNQNTVDFRKTMTVIESNGTNLDLDNKWQKRFEGLPQFKSFSDSFKTSDVTVEPLSSSAAAFPEAKVYNTTVSSTAEKDSTFSQAMSDRTETGSGWGLERSWEEFSAPAGDKAAQREGETDGIRSPDSSVFITGYSTLQTNCDDFNNEEDDSFCGVFKATLVDFIPESPSAPTASPPSSPEEKVDSPSQFEMDILRDTLKNMEPLMRMRSLSARGPQTTLMSSLPPIVEDAPSPVTAGVNNITETDGLNGLYILPPDIGLKSRSLRDTRSPLELMKQSQQEQQVGTRSLNMPLRASATNSIVMRNSSDSSSEDLLSPVLQNGTGSRLDNSIIFSSFRSSSMDQTTLENGKSDRTLFRAASLPDIGLSNDRLSVGPKGKDQSEIRAGTDSSTSRYERLSFLFNSSSSSLTGGEDFSSRMSFPPSLGISSPSSSDSPTPLLSPTGSIEMNSFRVGAPHLQRSFSGDSGVSVQQPSMFNNVHAGPHFQIQEPEPERNLMSKYRAFPDAYLTKLKEHGKLNPRPGKMYIFECPGMCGQRIEIGGDIIDATSWELEETFSIRVVRGGWVLYEKPNFKGEKVALDEGDIELTCPFGPIEEEPPNGQMGEGQMNGEQTNGEQTNGETSEKPAEDKPVRLVIGSIRRAVRDYSVPEICLFPEENAEGKKVVFRDTSEDARIFGFPIKANSIIINAGLWLVYAEPFFQGAPRVLEVGGFSNPAAWGVEQPYIASLHPLKIGEPHVENMGELKMVVYEKPYFCGKSRTITTNTKDFMTKEDPQQKIFMYNVGSLKVVGGIWVGYEKEGFRGHQYLLEEGDYQDWRVWGGCDSELRSVRVIRADLTDPVMMMFEQPDEEQEEMQEEESFEVTEAIPDVELFGLKPFTRSIHVVSGAWVAYSHVDFSGDQYILEKGFYNNSADWGAQDNRICSVQPILSVPRDDIQNTNEIFLYNEPHFQGQCHVIDRDVKALSDKILPKSCKVMGGSWVLYENKEYSGNLYVLSEGDYPNLTSMGCPANCSLRSVKAVPRTFTMPSISLFGLECLEGREITIDSEIFSLVEEGYNNHILSVRVNRGCWVICEHGNYRGRQFLLEPIEITNWPKFSSLQTIGSMYPVRQKRSPFRIRNKERGHFLSVQGGVEELKSGRVVVTPEVEPMSDIWYYQNGLIKNKLAPTMSLQVMGKIEPASKVVLWTETRQPVQSWTAQMRGLITSLTFPGMVLDVKGGKTYDKDHVVIMPENDERLSQQWEIELL